MNHLPQGAGQRHVQAVIVAWRQVNRREFAAHEGRCPGRLAAQQGLDAVIHALGLDDAARFDPACLAQEAVSRGYDGVTGLGDRPDSGFQRAGEKIVETGIGREIGLFGLRHVDAIGVGDGPNQEILDEGRLTVGKAAHGTGQGMMGQGVLARDENFLEERHDEGGSV